MLLCVPILKDGSGRSVGCVCGGGACRGGCWVYVYKYIFMGMCNVNSQCMYAQCVDVYM